MCPVCIYQMIDGLPHDYMSVVAVILILGLFIIGLIGIANHRW